MRHFMIYLSERIDDATTKYLLPMVIQADSFDEAKKVADQAWSGEYVTYVEEMFRE